MTTVNSGFSESPEARRRRLQESLREPPPDTSAPGPAKTAPEVSLASILGSDSAKAQIDSTSDPMAQAAAEDDAHAADNAIEAAAVDTSHDKGVDGMMADADVGEHAGENLDAFGKALDEEDTDLLASAEEQQAGRESPISELLQRLKRQPQTQEPDAADQDGNGIDDELDADREADESQVDGDNDGQPDVLENAEANDGADQDGDGQLDIAEGAQADARRGLDADGDGTPDMVDPTPPRTGRPQLNLENAGDAVPRTRNGGLDLHAANSEDERRRLESENRRLQRKLDRAAMPPQPKAKPPPVPKGGPRLGGFGGFRGSGPRR